MKLSLSVIVPAFNEAENLPPVLNDTIQELDAMLSAELSDYQLVIIDDGSTDDTQSILERFAEKHERVTLLSHGTNRGLGAAIKTGFAAARKDYVTFMPADGQVPMRELRKLLPGALAGADVVVGYYTQRREIDGLTRAFLSRGLRTFTELTVGMRFRLDGPYVFRRRLLWSLPLKSDSFFVNLELPLRAMRAHLDVRSAALEVRPRLSGNSKVLGLKSTMRVARDALKLRFHFILEDRQRRP